MYKRALRLLGRAEKAKNHFACVGFIRELRCILVSLYEIAAEVAPKSTGAKAPDEAYIAAVTRALGCGRPLVPLHSGEPTAMEVEVLPVKQLPASVTTQSNDDEFLLENLP